MTKSKKKIIFLTTSFILTICLMGFMGVYALTILKNSQINVGISYQPEYLVKVEMGIDGANSGTFNQTIEETEYVEIYNSLNPVSNGMYIQSISSDTIRLEANSLTPDSTGFVYFKFYILDGETKSIFASVNCGETTEKTSTLKETATQLSIQTGVTTDNPALLGALKINIKFEEMPCYTVYEYASGKGPVYNNNTSNRYVHYIEMGEYPQSYAGTKTEISATQQGTYYVDNNDGSKKYALKGSNYYLVEPVRWIVIGVTNGLYGDEGEHVLFTTGNQARNESSSSGLWRYDEETNTFQYRTATSEKWEDATEVLVLSEYGLLRSTTTSTHFSGSNATKVLNDEDNANSLYNTMFTDNQRTKIIPKTIKITSFYGNLNSTGWNTLSYNMFLLGSNRNYTDYDGYINTTDSYNLSTYFTPANTGSSQSNLVAKETAYSSGGTQNSASSWWLRSGIIDYLTDALCVDSTGKVDGDPDVNSYALRPAFVLNLA